MSEIMNKTTGEILRELREQRGMTQEELAEALDVSNTYIAMVETGKREGKPLLPKLALFFGIDLQVLYGDKPIPEYQPKPKPLKSLLQEVQRHIDALEILEFPILGEGPAGTPCIQWEQNLGTVKVLKSSVQGIPDLDKLFAVIVKGESLSGDNIHDQDRLLIYPIKEVDINGKIYTCNLGEQCVIKHVELTKDGKYRLHSTNDHYQDIEPGELEIVGRAIKKIPQEQDL